MCAEKISIYNGAERKENIKMEKLENVFFDLDDTLWACSENSKDTFMEVYEDFHFYRYFDSFDHFFSLYEENNNKLWSIYGEGKITKDELNDLRFAHPLLCVGVKDKQLIANYRETYLDRIKRKGKLIDGAKELLDYSFNRYNLYILSNGFREMQFSKMEASGILHYFKKVVLSEDYGVMKPNREIFHLALSITKSTVSNSIMIGDNWNTDILGAKNINMSQIFYDPNSLFDRSVFCFQPTYVVDSLLKIRDIL